MGYPLLNPGVEEVLLLARVPEVYPMRDTFCHFLHFLLKTWGNQGTLRLVVTFSTRE